MTKRYFGKVCAKHPELKGERLRSNRDCIGCGLERLRAYREKNKEKMLERVRAYREKNKEKITKWRRKYREDMPAEQREIYLAKCKARNYERRYDA